MTLRKQDGATVSEYTVDPAQIAPALAEKACFDTGMLSQNTILRRQEGVTKTMVEYRPPGKTGIFLEGVETALRVSLPRCRTLTAARSGGAASERGPTQS